MPTAVSLEEAEEDVEEDVEEVGGLSEAGGGGPVLAFWI